MNLPGGDIGNPNDPNNKLLLMSLQQVNETNMGLFLMQNPDFVEDKDAADFKKSLISTTRCALGVCALGVVLNVQLKRIPNFLKLHAVVRLPLRVPVFFCPALLFKAQFEQNLGKAQDIYFKYFKRISNVKRTGDLRYFDPQGILQQQFERKMKSLQ